MPHTRSPLSHPSPAHPATGSALLAAAAPLPVGLRHVSIRPAARDIEAGATRDGQQESGAVRGRREKPASPSAPPQGFLPPRDEERLAVVRQPPQLAARPRLYLRP